MNCTCPAYTNETGHTEVLEHEVRCPGYQPPLTNDERRQLRNLLKRT